MKLTFTRYKAISITMICVLLLTFACAPAPSVPPTTVPSIAATSTPHPTETLTPTATILPSATLPPSPTTTPLIANAGQVSFSESFEDMSFAPLNFCGKGRIESGALVVERDPVNKKQCGMFAGGIYNDFPLSPDTTLIVLFRASKDFNIGVHAGDYQTETLRRFTYTLTPGIGSWDLMTGMDTDLYNSWPANATIPEHWYYFSLKRSSNGDLVAKVWERDNPKNLSKFEGNLGVEWGTLPLTFVTDFKDAPFLLDEYQILK
ncbi:MAG: hypothetical protein QM730_29925 [Anaerolineales bacterium]